MTTECHEITENDKIIWQGQVPWHGLGEQIQAGMTATEACAQVMPWSVFLDDMYTFAIDEQQERIDNELYAVHGWRAVRRSDTQDTLGVVQGRYTPYQNQDLAAVLDAILAVDGANVETAGTLAGGRLVWFLMSLEAGNFSLNGNDAHKQFLLGTTSHDGSIPTSIFETFVRVVCKNTHTGALRDGRDGMIKIRHTKSSHQRMDDAVATLTHAQRYAERYQTIMQAMSETAYSREELHTLALRLVGGAGWQKWLAQIGQKNAKNTKKPSQALRQQTGAEILAGMLNDTSTDDKHKNAEVPNSLLSPQARRSIETIDEIFRNAERGNNGQTAYDAFNAVTDYCDHEKTTKNTSKNSAQENAAASAWFGSSRTTKKTALDMILQDTGLAERV